VRPGEAHLFTVKLDDARDPELLESYRALLSPDERARGERYLFEHSKHQHVVAHGLKRLALSRLSGADPRAWTFAAGEHGKPSITGPDRALSFNLSHTDGLVAVLVAGGGEVGVDVEDTERRTDYLAIADRFFSAAEVAALRALPPAGWKARFFEIWTLKEAYLKACGAGLALPLASFWFDLPSTRITFAPPIVDDPGRWRFFQGWVAPRFRVAAAIEVRGVEPSLVIAGTEPPRPPG
jgi:4'-phosphopantetheinyl transferase